MLSLKVSPANGALYRGWSTESSLDEDVVEMSSEVVDIRMSGFIGTTLHPMHLQSTGHTRLFLTHL